MKPKAYKARGAGLATYTNMATTSDDFILDSANDQYITCMQRAWISDSRKRVRLHLDAQCNGTICTSLTAIKLLE